MAKKDRYVRQQPILEIMLNLKGYNVFCARVTKIRTLGGGDQVPYTREGWSEIEYCYNWDPGVIEFHALLRSFGYNTPRGSLTKYDTYGGRARWVAQAYIGRQKSLERDINFDSIAVER